MDKNESIYATNEMHLYAKAYTKDLVYRAFYDLIMDLARDRHEIHDTEIFNINSAVMKILEMNEYIEE